MKSRKIRILSTGVILLCTAGLLSGCGDDVEDAVTESKEVITDEPIQSVETIIESEPVMSLDDMERIETLDETGVEEETGSMEGILDELSDSANNAIDAAQEVTTETTDIMKDYVDENVADAQSAIGDMQEDVSTAIVEPVADVFEDAEEVVTATPDLTRRVQQALVNSGYNPGPVDGISGPKTLQAIKNFQQENNLAAGELTKETLRALGVEY
ncbi:peptidoglycan-binding domain-containing protein [Nitrosomonas aestuarii]|uniref:peptidoglycan-binding domain-containing protein n=1 Tax=Nitrosomonas aestuarii TaxID=52441 RepID=UPI000D4FF708|nr:peptidoglycan-binding domain-containing protein [Nitrosomonas aestuarii]PTN12210.1 putative peptidoglycan binding protein [Nitrosomonas aestuarii]